MENQTNNQITPKEDQPAAIDWHGISCQGISIGKFLVLVFILCVLVTGTINLLPVPYSIFVVGLEIALGAILVFTILRTSTSKQIKPYDYKKLKEEKEPVKLLLTKINDDIGWYGEGSSYYFKSVQFYKYSTIVLAGISTIILGLDLSGIENRKIFGNMDYTTFAKNVALIIGAVITVTTSLVTYWNIEKYWMTNKTIVNKLKALKDDIESDFVAGKLTGYNELQKKIDEYKGIKGDFYKYWEGALADRGSQSGQSAAI